MSVAFILNPSYSYVENNRLNQELEVTTSLKAPVHYVEDLTISKNLAGSMVLDAPVVEATVVQTDSVNAVTGVFTSALNPLVGSTDVSVAGNLDLAGGSGLLNVTSLTVEGSAAVAGYVLKATDTAGSLEWAPDVAGAPTLADVLVNGNSAGSTSIDMNNQDITSANVVSSTTLKGDVLTTADPLATQINVGKNLNLSTNTLFAQTINAGNTITSASAYFGVEPNRWTGFDAYTLKQVDGDNRVVSDSGADLVGWHDVQSIRGKFYTTDASAAELFSASSDGAVVCEELTTKNIVIPLATPAAGDVLKSDGAGAIYWAADVNTPAAWSQYAATQTVDMASNSLDNVQNITMTGALNCNQINPLTGSTEVSITGDVNMVGHRIDADVGYFSGKVSVASLFPTYIQYRTLFVSSNGSDTNNGSFEAPVKTIQRAIDYAESAYDNTYWYINVLPGTYAGFTVTKKVFVKGAAPSNSDACSVGCQINSDITVAINANDGDMFNNAFTLSNFLIAGAKIVDSSSARHVLNITDCYLYNDSGTGRLVDCRPSSSDCRLFIFNSKIVNVSAVAGDPMVELGIGMARFYQTQFQCAGVQNVVKFSGTSRVDSIVLCSFTSTNASAVIPPIIEITSTSTSVFTFGNCSFVYSSATNKTASPSSCAIYGNSATTPAVITILYNTFSLAGTSDPQNHVINYNTVPCISYFFSNGAVPGTCFRINGTHTTLQAVV